MGELCMLNLWCDKIFRIELDAVANIAGKLFSVLYLLENLSFLDWNMST